MKTTIKLFLLSAVILLSSCGSSDVTALKKKYNPGFYLSFKHNKKTNNSASTVSKKKAAIYTAAKVLPAKESHNTKQSLAVAANGISIQDSEVASVACSIAVPVIVENNTSIEAPVKLSKIQQKIANRINKKAGKISAIDDIDSDTLVLVILALFPILSLIAMYLKDGNSITNNFWINLLLHLTVIGYAVFGVLVVLDIINLA